MDAPAWLRTAVFYQVYPQSFADANGDGIGDLPGLIGRLDYLASLGVDALWLNPIFVSPMRDAGYDVADFRRVDPRYGTNEDARRLFVEAHRRGMRVVLDLVAGHSSDQHPWFQDACRDPKSPASGRYIFADEHQTALFGASETRIPGGVRDGWYQPNFFAFQPALNYGYQEPDPAKPWQRAPDHPDCLQTRLELRDIMRFWLDMGCDGFRVDMAQSLIKNDPQGVGIRALWRGMRAWMTEAYPEAVLVSEWSHPTDAIAAGFHIDFLIHFNDTCAMHLAGPFGEVDGDRRVPHVFFERAGEGDITLFLAGYRKHLEATVGKGYISTPTGNHDFHRPRKGRDLGDLRPYHAMMLTLPGVPFLYYGDEIGMRNLDGLPEKEGSMWRAANRTPMQWGPGANLGFSTAPAEKLYLPVDAAADAPTVAAQEQDPGSLLHLVRSLVALRKAHPAMGNDGGFTPLYAKPGQYPFVYERSTGEQRVVVVINPAGRATEADLGSHGLTGATPLLAEGVVITGDRVRCAPVSFGIFLR